MVFNLNIPTPGGHLEMQVEPGSSAIFVGANGGGKSRLAVFIENAFGLKAHRISAHRALQLNPDVTKISEKKAIAGLRTGHPSENASAAHRAGNRWASQENVSLLNDFDYLIQALFAEQANKSINTPSEGSRWRSRSSGSDQIRKISRDLGPVVASSPTPHFGR